MGARRRAFRLTRPYQPSMKRIVLLAIPFALVLALGAVQFYPVSSQTAAATPTTVSANPQSLTEIHVRVVSRGGKFLGDDIGGALVTLRDARSGELLASGRTRGGSGAADLMTLTRARGTPLPTTDAAVFTATLPLDEPRLVEFEAYGPLAAQGAATRVTTTQWVLPQALTGYPNHIQIEIPGLNVEVIEPPTHFLPVQAPPVQIRLRANVTMMCGCPIGRDEPWHPENYLVKALLVKPDGTRDLVPLEFDANAPDHAPSQFTATYTAAQAGVYEVIVMAYQLNEGNTGSDRATFIVQ